MKTRLIAIVITVAANLAFGHEGIELGPNKGRILELSADESIQGEVTTRDGKLHITLLNKEMKPIKIADQTIAATAGTRQSPTKLKVEKTADGFSLPIPGEDEWLIVQFKVTPNSKPVTARLHYNTDICAPCGKPEWRCACGEEEDHDKANHRPALPPGREKQK
jgi:hypothetical protein